MAYDALRKTKEQQGQSPQTNPYSALTAEPQGSTAQPGLVMPSSANFGLPGASGPSATGYVNFDSLYNANADVAKREADSRAGSAESKAKAAQQGLTGAQNQFNQAAGAGSHAPTAEEQSWATNGQTGVDTGKKVVGVGYNPQTVWNTPTVGGGYQGKQVPLEHRRSDVVTADAGSDEAERRSVAMGYPDNNGKKWGSVDEYDAAHRQPADAPPEPANRSASGKTVTEEQQSDESPVIPPKLDADGKPVPGTGYPPYDPSKPNQYDEAISANAKDPAAIQAALKAGAAQKYSGPAALSSMDAYGQLTKDTTAAQDEINNPLTGLNDTDRALLGAAGRPRFSQLQSQYGHLGADLDRANVNSQKQAQAARAQSQSDAAAYQGLLDEYGGRAGADEATRKANDDASDAAMGDLQKQVDEGAAFQKQKEEARNPRNVLHDIAGALSPSDTILHAMGYESPLDMGANYFADSGVGSHLPQEVNDWGGFDKAPVTSKKKRKKLLGGDD